MLLTASNPVLPRMPGTFNAPSGAIGGGSGFVLDTNEDKLVDDAAAAKWRQWFVIAPHERWWEEAVTGNRLVEVFDEATALGMVSEVLEPGTVGVLHRLSVSFYATVADRVLVKHGNLSDLTPKKRGWRRNGNDFVRLIDGTKQVRTVSLVGDPRKLSVVETTPIQHPSP